MFHPAEMASNRSTVSNPLSHVIAAALDAVGNVLERAQHSRRDAWLASAADLYELDRRVRSDGLDD